MVRVARRALWYLALPATLAACASRPAAPPTPTPAPVPVTPAPPPPAAAPVAVAAFAWAPAARAFEVRIDAEVSGDATAPPGAAPERVQTVVYLRDTVSAGAAPGAVRVTGVADSVLVTASARVRGDAPIDSATPATAAAPTPPAPPADVPRAAATGVPYRAAGDARGVRVDAGQGVDLRCTAPAGAAALGALAAVRETLPRVPANTLPGARWRDTTVSAACAGPALLVVQTAARYEAEAGANGALVVVRRATSTLRGQGAAGVRPVAVTGTATTEARWALDPARGALVGGEGTGETALAVTVAGTTQRFVQRTRTRITPR